jgi:hypothetical protein
VISLESVAIVSRRLRWLGIAHVFVGGSIVPLLLDEPSLHNIRPTKDVDTIVKVATRAVYAQLEEQLRDDGFCNVQNGPICRYRVEDCIVDVMPTDGSILGIKTRWFTEALETAELKQVVGEMVPIIAPEYFLATKLEAFKDRGNGDYLGSKDIQDFLAVVDGCSAIVGRISRCPSKFQKYIAEEFNFLNNESRFHDALPGHLDDYNREPIVLERVQSIASLAGPIEELEEET